MWNAPAASSELAELRTQDPPDRPNDQPAQLDLMVVTQEIWSALTVPYIRYKDGQASHAIPPHRRHGS